MTARHSAPTERAGGTPCIYIPKGYHNTLDPLNMRRMPTPGSTSVGAMLTVDMQQQGVLDRWGPRGRCRACNRRMEIQALPKTAHAETTHNFDLAGYHRPFFRAEL